MNDYIDFNTYKVYVKTDENGIITAVNSSAFLADVTGWAESRFAAGGKGVVAAETLGRGVMVHHAVHAA